MNFDNEAFHQGAPKSAKMRLLADWIDVVDRVHNDLIKALPQLLRHPETGEVLAPFRAAHGDVVQRDLREWAACLEAGEPLYNTPRDPTLMPKLDT